MTLFTFLLGLVSIIAFSQAIPLSDSPGLCFWQEDELGDYHQCNAQFDPDDVGGATLSVYTFLFYEPSPPSGSTYLKDITDAATAAMKIYKDFLHGKDLDLVVYPVSDLTDVYAYTHFNSPSSACYIRVTTQEPGNHALPRPSIDFKQTVAHELYHCAFLPQLEGLDTESCRNTFSIVYNCKLCGGVAGKNVFNYGKTEFVKPTSVASVRLPGVLVLLVVNAM
jgi:hypothetical protein